MLNKRQLTIQAAVFQLISTAGMIALYPILHTIGRAAERSSEGVTVSWESVWEKSFAHWAELGLGFFVFTVLIAMIVAAGYFCKQKWVWNLHLVKAGGLAYGAVTLIPAVFTMQDSYFLILAIIVFIDAMYLISIASAKMEGVAPPVPKKTDGTSTQP